MATKTIEQEIKEALKAKKLLIGSRRVFRCVRRGSVKSVIYASNCPEGAKKDLNRYAALSKIDIKEFAGNSSRLGEICGKPFNVLVVGVQK